VEVACRALEDDVAFNAGTGAALNSMGKVELDASMLEERASRLEPSSSSSMR